MNINGSDFQSKLVVYRSAQVQGKDVPAASADASTSTASSQDRVVLSQRWRLISDAQQAIASIPDVRESLVSEIQSDLQRGAYVIDYHRTAEGILRESMVNQAAMM